MTERRVVYLVELQCFQCGREIGKPMVAQASAPIPAYWLTQRCRTCGGQPMRTGEVERRVFEPKVDLREPRGRPPAWLVAERAQEAALL